MSKNSNKYEGLRYPPLNDLIAKVHNKYELVLATSKRARELVDGAIPFVNYDVENPISIATEEIDEGKIHLSNPALSEEDGETLEIKEEASTEETETDTENTKTDSEEPDTGDEESDTGEPEDKE